MKWRQENDKQTHFIRNLNAPREQKTIHCESKGFHTNFFGFLVYDDPHLYTTKAPEPVLGLYYADHEDEFWKYHQRNEFNQKWIQKYKREFHNE